MAMVRGKLCDRHPELDGLRDRSNGQCVECRREYQRILYAGNLGQYKLKAYRNNARDRGIAWELTSEQACELFERACHWCGGPGGGIDRIDNEPWYRPENSVPCCARCNAAKRTDTRAEFLLRAVKIVNEELRRSGMEYAQLRDKVTT